MVHGNTRYFVMITGNTLDSHKTFLDRLSISSNLHEVRAVNKSDVIIAFVPVVSRAGTDILSAMEIIPKDKPVVLVILHHTFDPDIVVPDVRRHVNRTDVFAVDCLFHEDQGLLRCLRNDDAINAVKDHLCGIKNPKVEQTSYKRKVLDAVIGAVIGAVFGAVISALAVELCNECDKKHCNEGAVAGTGAGIGAGFGTVTGLLILITSKYYKYHFPALSHCLHSSYIPVNTDLIND
ncbi:uncharacterized protein LOC113660615 isoform X2 [Tachysurus fulvidraco]|uniref:uncharacterized protein LOC113660615 isoform X2 n=1 Tax=Tachysurus fulvidraco TaxID=1234273 RepID=UPI001FEF4951|nr:uncharacterized protein LOC113660615 isoform X2 [Tachysurus fulvidraco]